MTESKCPRCGARVLQTDTHCLDCGYELLPPAPTPASSLSAVPSAAAGPSRAGAAAKVTELAHAVAAAAACVVATTGDLHEPYDVIGTVFGYGASAQKVGWF